jgi:hypothetical protein
MRYLAPLCPWLLLSLFASLLFVQQFASKIRLPGCVLTARVVTCLVVSSALLEETVLYLRAHKRMSEISFTAPGGKTTRYCVFGYFRAERELNSSLEWLRQAGHSTAILGTSAPTWAHVRTGMKAVIPPLEMDTDSAEKLLQSVPVNYLIADDSFSRRYVTAVVQRYPGVWQEIYSAPRGTLRVYQNNRRPD